MNRAASTMLVLARVLLPAFAATQDTLLNGANGIAALTFRNVPILPSKPTR